MNFSDASALRPDAATGPVRGALGALVIEDLDGASDDAVALFTICIRSTPAGSSAAVR
ncbi:hypothetical protein ABT218_08100 [Streptomyces sp. NPDC001455]|uniref:hypothetical protein n=1 Tax=unclassified Streptomyces TaxID=2593676 RepID=UPI0033250F5F